MVTHKTKGKKSLRQLAKELSVSHSYLSQVLNGKRPASEKIAYRLSREGLLSLSGKQVVSRYGNQNLLEIIEIMTYNESTSGCNSAEECLLPKQDVVGSNPITRSIAKFSAIPPFFLYN